MEYLNKFEGVEVEKVIAQYTQPGDTCQDRDETQLLQLETENSGAGPFIRMSLPEGGFWSVDNIDDLNRIFEDFTKKVNAPNTYFHYNDKNKEIISSLKEILKIIKDNNTLTYPKLSDDLLENVYNEINNIIKQYV
jgi:hypothetical protein